MKIDHLIPFLDTYLIPKKINGVQDKKIIYKVNETEFYPRITRNLQNPKFDRNEEYQDLYECFTGQPWDFQARQLSQFKKLPMNGFAQNYYRVLQNKNTNLDFEQVQQIADVLSPDCIPIFSSLALDFGLADRYFSDIPSNTLGNSAFILLASSNGNVTN